MHAHTSEGSLASLNLIRTFQPEKLKLKVKYAYLNFSRLINVEIYKKKKENNQIPHKMCVWWQGNTLFSVLAPPMCFVLSWHIVSA